jgi:hypothetical protein
VSQQLHVVWLGSKLTAENIAVVTGRVRMSCCYVRLQTSDPALITSYEFLQPLTHEQGPHPAENRFELAGCCSFECAPEKTLLCPLQASSPSISGTEGQQRVL